MLVAFVVVFLAEFGDKTEVLTLALAARSGPWPVLAPEHPRADSRDMTGFRPTRRETRDTCCLQIAHLS